MNNNIKNIGIGEYTIGEGNDILYTSSLGSCLGIVIYDRTSLKAGLIHILLPNIKNFKNKENPLKYADSGINILIKKLTGLGIYKKNLAVKIAGGSNPKNLSREEDYFKIGYRNFLSAEKVLKNHKIPIISKDIGEEYSRSLEFNIRDRKLKIKRNGREIIYI